MLIENAKRAIEALKTDQILRNQVEFATTAEEKVAVANAAGFDFTLADFKQAMKEQFKTEPNANDGLPW